MAGDSPSGSSSEEFHDARSRQSRSSHSSGRSHRSGRSGQSGSGGYDDRGSTASYPSTGYSQPQSYGPSDSGYYADASDPSLSASYAPSDGHFDGRFDGGYDSDSATATEDAERTARRMDAFMAGAPIAGQGAAMAAAAARGQGAVQGYGFAVGTTGGAGALEAARQLSHLRNVRQNPDRRQPAFDPVRFTGGVAMAAGGGVYGAGAGMNSAAMQAGGAMAQGVATGVTVSKRQRMHDPSRVKETDRDSTLPFHNQDAQGVLASQSERHGSRATGSNTTGYAAEHSGKTKERKHKKKEPKKRK